MKYIKIYPWIIGTLLLCVACEDFVEVELPNHKITSETVFNNDETARSAMQGIYNQLFNSSFANGGIQSVTFLSGVSADNFQLTTNVQEIREFGQNNITADNASNLSLWAGAYNVIYMANSLLEGIENNTDLSEEVKQSLEGEAKFVRAFSYFYLTNVYREVPLILQTDYQQNAVAPRDAQAAVYDQIVLDLYDAIELLPEAYTTGERTRPNRYAAMAFMARVYLYVEDWQQAADVSSQVISQASLYELLPNLDDLFLANSREAIWQISPLGWGGDFTHTREGNLFIQNATDNTPVALSNDFIEIWEDPQDLRRNHWIALFEGEGENLYYAYKYKVSYDASGGAITEYSMVMRLAEQYLIRAEARARMGNTAGAIEDLDKIRGRAGTPLLAEVQPNPSPEELLNLLLAERRKELFGEWGHRWLDLRRFGNAMPLEEKDVADWQANDWWYPIPQEERNKNPQLSQNEGY